MVQLPKETLFKIPSFCFLFDYFWRLQHDANRKWVLPPFPLIEKQGEGLKSTERFGVWRDGYGPKNMETQHMGRHCMHQVAVSSNDVKL